MQAYLAEKYMSGPKANMILAKTTNKKKKRKIESSTTGPSASSNFMIQDDDGGWGNERKQGDDDADIEEAVVASDRSFKKRKVIKAGDENAGWSTVREGIKQETPPPEDERPTVVEDSSAAPLGGLVSAAQLKKMQKPKERKQEETAEEIAAAQETIYRDASGRKIDTKAERAEAARKKREREEAEAKKMEWGKGLVQRGEEERRRQQLELEKKRDLAVYADDKDLNDEQKAQERWNDPAMAFLTKTRSKGPKKPQYTGPPPPPNRFGIKPGYRWDGVDRSNGFEKKLFQKTNERKRSTLESHQWSVDDM